VNCIPHGLGSLPIPAAAYFKEEFVMLDFIKEKLPE